MTIDEEANRLRSELARMGASHGRRYLPGMKELILAWIDRAKTSGMEVAEASRRIGVSSRQLSSWRASVRAAHTKALVPVEVASEPVTAVAFVAPGGFRIEGITVAQAIELLRAFT